MKPIRNLVAALGAALFVALQTVTVGAVALGVVACASVPTDTFNDKAAITLRSVTTAREVSNALLGAGKITTMAHRDTETKLDAIVTGVANARKTYQTDPAAGTVALKARDDEAKKIEATLQEKR